MPLAPGGGVSVLARLMADYFTQTQGVTALVENRPGGGTVIATEAVSRAPADGDTILMTANSFTINPHLRKLNYDPLSSFTPICLLVRTPTAIVVESASPFRTFAELISAARAKPGELTIASVGPTTSFHLGIEVLKRVAGINMTYVPYPGNTPAITALLGGHVTAVFANYPEFDELLKAGKVRALATGAQTRIESLPDVPTVAESGYKGYDVETVIGLVVPDKTAKDTVSQLRDWSTAALRNPDISRKLTAQGLYPVAMCGEEYGVYLRKQYEEYGRIIREANIKAQ